MKQLLLFLTVFLSVATAADLIDSLSETNEFIYDDTSHIPFTDSLYYNTQSIKYNCLKLIDFKSYRPVGVKKYTELFRVFREIESRPVCFEFGIRDTTFDLIIKHATKPIASGQCKSNDLDIKIISNLNQPLSNHKEVSKLLNNIRSYKPFKSKISSTASIEIEYYNIINRYYFWQHISAYDAPEFYDNVMKFIKKEFEQNL